MSLQNKISHLTEFHRDRLVFEALEKNIIPSFHKSPIKIVSIGCSEGREVYSILLQHWKDWDRLGVIGYDPEQDLIEIAKKGEYDTGYGSREYEWIRSLNIPEGDAYRVEDFWHLDIALVMIRMSEDAKKHAEFKTGNILSNPIQGKYDIGLVLNLLYHFTEEERGRALENMFVNLNEGGWLVCEPDPSWISMGYGRYVEWMKDITRFGFEKQTEIVCPRSSQVYRKEIC